MRPDSYFVEAKEKGRVKRSESWSMILLAGGGR